MGGTIPRLGGTAATLVAASLLLGCATLLGGNPEKSRKDAIAACVEEVPPETVPYADTFAACMERYGWVHRATSSGTDG